VGFDRGPPERAGAGVQDEPPGGIDGDDPVAVIELQRADPDGWLNSDPG
jgi:hypothetical protein